MNLRIALAGNPNSGKTTLFNALTGANQFVGNWPGVTVEKKEGGLKNHDGVMITDLPGIYSLSPYTSEEVVARNYLIGERPEAILNIVDGTNLERNLYLTTQLAELGIPMVVAINMMDLVKKRGDRIDITQLSKAIGCRVVEISALRGDGVMEAALAAIDAAQNAKIIPGHTFSGVVEHVLAHIEEAVLHTMPKEQRRWYAIKIFERDNKVLEQLDKDVLTHIEEDIQAAEKKWNDDAESIIIGERYIYIGEILEGCYQKSSAEGLSTSDKIDKIVTNRWLGLPIFALVMFLVYYISMVTIGGAATDWTNDGLFGDGWHLFGIGSAAYEEAEKRYGDSDQIINAFVAEYGNAAIANALNMENAAYSKPDAKKALETLIRLTPADANVIYQTVDEETLEETEHPGATKAALEKAVEAYLETDDKRAYGAPDTSTYGVWIPGIPVLVREGLEAAGTADWLAGLINDGIVAGVGAVLGFVPQMLVLFALLAFLEASGYMSRIAFVLDRIFRKFGLSGKSFIPMLVGMGCGVPGIMASRTIENERDRRMTVMTTTFIPCGAKVPFIAMIAGALFDGSAWISTSAYFIGMAAIVLSGIILKKTRMFSGDPAPFVMELPAYHWPTVKNVLYSTWERGWSFIKKAGTLILLSTILIWFTTYFGFVDGAFRMLTEEEIDHSILAAIGGVIAWIFKPLGWGTWQAAVASVTGLVAKENIVGTMGILYGAAGNVYTTLGSVFTSVTAYSFLVFNLLCAPCFAAMGAIKQEMNSAKWTLFAIAYQCGFAYIIALMINQFGGLFTGTGNIGGLIIAVVALVGMLYMLIRPYKEAGRLMKKAGAGS